MFRISNDFSSGASGPILHKFHRLGEWKIAKMVAVHRPRWPPCPYMVKIFKNLLLQNIEDRGSTKVAKIMVVQVCFPMHLFGKKHLKILFSKISHKDALWLNLCTYYWEHLHVCSGYVTQVSEPWPVGLLFILKGNKLSWGLAMNVVGLNAHPLTVTRLCFPLKRVQLLQA